MSTHTITDDACAAAQAPAPARATGSQTGHPQLQASYFFSFPLTMLVNPVQCL